ncbi:MAG: hypothetical protein EOP12_02220 [Pseudomonas sp.]|nr:MAG: hypothetical protein EOP12_02220 [Pseudomonas sp.]
MLANIARLVAVGASVNDLRWAFSNFMMGLLSICHRASDIDSSFAAKIAEFPPRAISAIFAWFSKKFS